MRYFRVQVASEVPCLHGGRLNYQIKQTNKQTTTRTKKTLKTMKTGLERNGIQSDKYQKQKKSLISILFLY